jgi:glutamate carboxypeptidase
VSFESRFWTVAEAERVDKAVHALSSVDTRARLSVEGGVHKPPMERAAATPLLDAARACARDIGWDLCDTAVGGVSDGNITAGMGVPTLDGVGGVGAGAHSVDEYVEVAQLPVRARWLAGLIRRLSESSR